MNDNLVLGTLLMGFSRRESQRQELQYKPGVLGVREKKCKVKKCANHNVTHLHAGPASQVMKKHSRPFCLANRTSPEEMQEGIKDGEFFWLLPFSCFLLGKSHENSLQLSGFIIQPLRGCLWNQMHQYDFSSKIGSKEATQHGRGADQKEKEKVIEERWKAEFCVKQYLLIWSSAWRTDKASKVSHIELGKKNQQYGLQKELLPSKSHTPSAVSALLLPVQECYLVTQNYLVTNNTALQPCSFQRHVKMFEDLKRFTISKIQNW